MPHALRRLARPLAIAFLPLVLAGCETARNVTSGLLGPATPAGTPGFVQGFLGGVAAEEPVAAQVARDVLSAGGNAGDAAVAAGFALAVTLPSRVGLGGGGACVVFDTRRGEPEAVLFLPGAREVPAGDRPAALPMLARGLFLLQSRTLNARPFEELISPAEQLARFGAPMSRALHADLEAVRAPLFADAEARAVFGRPDGSVIPVGETFRNAALAGTLSQLRVQGAGDLNQGGLARRLEESASPAGGGFTVAELRTALPRLARPLFVDARGGDRIAFLPPPADGGLAAAAAYQQLAAGRDLGAAERAAIGTAAAWRRGGGDPAALLAQPPGEGALPALPASAGLIVFDRNGNAVSCVFTMNNLFGTGRMAPGFGFLTAAAPGVGRTQPPLLSAAVVYAPRIRALKMVVAGSGQQAAPMAVAVPLQTVLLRDQPGAAAFPEIPAPGRAQIGSCQRYLPGWAELCTATTDPRGAGVALGATDR
ncbi:MAG: gamma-glutamyltransferase [Rubritepida sp.]|jgi:gamma-glutamyltranspeptidase/glutathione hydrolase|nr:gamma-glutamyltransferase [Rubritepida sp.]